MCFGAHNEGRVVGIRERAESSETIVAEDDTPNGFDLEIGKGFTKTSVSSSSESDESETNVGSFLSSGGKSLGIKLVGVGEDLGMSSRDCWRHKDRVSLLFSPSSFSLVNANNSIIKEMKKSKKKRKRKKEREEGEKEETLGTTKSDPTSLTSTRALRIKKIRGGFMRRHSLMTR